MSVHGKWIVVTAQSLQDRLYHWMCEQGWPVERFIEPTFGPAGVLIRQYRTGRIELDPFTLALLEAADRLDQWGGDEGIQSRLAAGQHVLCLHETSNDAAGEGDLDWRRCIQARCRPDLTLCAGEDGDGLAEEAWLAAQAQVRRLIEGDDAS